MKKTIIVLAVAAVLSGAGYYYYKDQNKTVETQAPQAFPVQVVKVLEEDFYPSLSFVSKIEA